MLIYTSSRSVATWGRRRTKGHIGLRVLAATIAAWAVLAEKLVA